MSNGVYPYTMGRKSSLVLVENLSRDGASIKILAGGNLKSQPQTGMQCLLEILKTAPLTGMGRQMVKCLVRQSSSTQSGSNTSSSSDGSKTGKEEKWDKKIKVVIECWIRSDPTTKKYNWETIKQVWDRIGLYTATEWLADQTRQIRANKWLTEMMLEKTRRRFETINLQEETD